MKQHITVKQLSELSGMQKKKLGEFVTGNDNFFLNNYPDQPNLLLLSIGQMIEFLDSLDLEVCISKPHLTQYEVAIYDKYTDKIQLNVDQGFYQGELCDALWKAVKEVLTPQKE